MRKPLLLSVLLIAAVASQAQKAPETKKWYGTFTIPLVQLSNLGIGVQPGVGYKINDKFQVLTEFAVRVFSLDNGSAEHQRYFRIQTEPRYLFSRSKNWNFYTGIRLAYSFRKFTDIDGDYYFNEYPHHSDSVTRFSRADVKSPIATTALQLGTVVSPSDKFTIDIFVGVGANYINTSYSNVVNGRRVVYETPKDGPLFRSNVEYNDNMTWLHVNVGMRAVFSF